MTRKIASVAFLFLCSLSSWGQNLVTFESQDEIKKTCQVIVDHFTNDAISEAFNVFREIWIIPKDELDYLEKTTIEQLNVVETKIGKSVENILVKENTIDNLLYKVVYVVKYERFGLRLEFVFYNGKDDKWHLSTFKWDDKLSELFND